MNLPSTKPEDWSQSETLLHGFHPVFHPDTLRRLGDAQLIEHMLAIQKKALEIIKEVQPLLQQPEANVPSSFDPRLRNFGELIGIFNWMATAMEKLEIPLKRFQESTNPLQKSEVARTFPFPSPDRLTDEQRRRAELIVALNLLVCEGTDVIFSAGKGETTSQPESLWQGRYQCLDDAHISILRDLKEDSSAKEDFGILCSLRNQALVLHRKYLAMPSQMRDRLNQLVAEQSNSVTDRPTHKRIVRLAKQILSAQKPLIQEQLQLSQYADYFCEEVFRSFLLDPSKVNHEENQCLALNFLLQISLEIAVRFHNHLSAN